MWGLSENLQLNVMVDALMTLLVTVILLSVLLDKTNRSTRGWFHFCISLVASVGYLLCEAAGYSAFYLEKETSTFTVAIGFAEVFFTLLQTSFLFLWVCDMISLREPVRRKTVFLLLGCFAGLTVVSSSVSFIAGLPTALYYAPYYGMLLAFAVTVIRHRRALKPKVVALVFFVLIGSVVSDFMPFWPYTLTNITYPFGILMVYIESFRWQREEIAEAKVKLAERETELAEAKVKAVLSQVEPHFLYNTLNTISALCEENPSLAMKVTDDFSGFLRSNLDAAADGKMIDFERELKNTAFYTDIEKVRFGDAVQVKTDLRATGFTVPALTLQPLVENAIKHGIRMSTEPGTVTIASEETDTHYIVTVTDDGVGFDPAQLPEDGRNHFGIYLVRKRLEVLCEGELILESAVGKGTKATVRIPKKRRKKA